ncbi:MAG: hypothetical protein HY864_03970 [Chloroflexi bacterium]|nr:hypothetical protein [Chloroflexota bacterium]
MFNNLSNSQKTAIQVVFVLALVGGAIALLISLGATKPKSDTRRVRFEVQASGGFAMITLQAGEVNIPDPKTVSVPWTQTVKIKSGTTVYLTASNPTATGELSCTITLDNADWKAEQTSAPKNGVACAGIVP